MFLVGALTFEQDYSGHRPLLDSGITTMVRAMSYLFALFLTFAGSAVKVGAKKHSRSLFDITARTSALRWLWPNINRYKRVFAKVRRAGRSATIFNTWPIAGQTGTA